LNGMAPACTKLLTGFHNVGSIGLLEFVLFRGETIPNGVNFFYHVPEETRLAE
jgi:hypothetical protein